MSFDKSLIIVLEIIASIGCFSIIPFAIITGRYFDRLLDLKKLPKPSDNGILPYGIVNRVSTYAVYILYNHAKAKKSGKYRDPYLDKIGDFNFRTYARPIDYFFIFLQLIGIIAFVLVLILILL